MFARTKEEEIEQVEGALAVLTAVERKPWTERQLFLADAEETPGAVTLQGFLFVLRVDHVLPAAVLGIPWCAARTELHRVERKRMQLRHRLELCTEPAFLFYPCSRDRTRVIHHRVTVLKETLSLSWEGLNLVSNEAPRF